MPSFPFSHPSQCEQGHPPLLRHLTVNAPPFHRPLGKESKDANLNNKHPYLDLEPRELDALAGLEMLGISPITTATTTTISSPSAPTTLAASMSGGGDVTVGVLMVEEGQLQYEPTAGPMEKTPKQRQRHSASLPDSNSGGESPPTGRRKGKGGRPNGPQKRSAAPEQTQNSTICMSNDGSTSATCSFKGCKKVRSVPQLLPLPTTTDNFPFSSRQRVSAFIEPAHMIAASFRIPSSPPPNPQNVFHPYLQRFSHLGNVRRHSKLHKDVIPHHKMPRLLARSQSKCQSATDRLLKRYTQVTCDDAHLRTLIS